MASITSVNSTIMLAVASVIPVAQKLQGYAAEDIFDSEQLANAEIAMGLDGILSAGWLPVAFKQNYTLMANSPSIDVFDAWSTSQQVTQDIYPANAIIQIPAIKRSFVMTNGILTGYSAMPDGKKTLQPRKFSITWEKVVPSPI